MKGKCVWVLLSITVRIVLLYLRRIVLIAFGLAALISESSYATENSSDYDSIDVSESRRIRNFENLTSSSNIELANRKLSELIREALLYSPNVREATYTASAARQDIEVARGARHPQITATLNSLYSTGDIASTSKANGAPGIVLSAQYPIFDWGRLAANVKVREEVFNSAIAREELIARQVAAEATNVCLELSKQKALLTANKEYVEIIQNLVNMLAKVTEADTGRAAELIQAKSRLLQAESSEATQRSKVREVRIRLERVLGQNKSSLCEDIGPHFLQLPNEDNLHEVVNGHPQVLISKADYAQQMRQLEQINASKKPQFNVTAQHAPVSQSLSNDYTQTITFAISAPIYDGKILESTERAALQRANAADERTVFARDQIFTDLRERSKIAATTLRRAKEFLSLAEINNKVRADFFLQWSALGKRSLFELLAIESEQFTLQSGYFTALYEGMAQVAYISANSGLLTSNIK